MNSVVPIRSDVLSVVPVINLHIVVTVVTRHLDIRDGRLWEEALDEGDEAFGDMH